MRKLTLLVFALMLLAVPAFAQDATPTPDTVPAVPAQPDAPEGDFTLLLTAIDAAGLTNSLANEGTFTLFAPTDAAFEAALLELGVSIEELLADTDTLTTLLTYHVVEGEFPVESLTLLAEQAGRATQVETLSGELIEVTLNDSGEPTLNSTVGILMSDVIASNGVIHVIDAVLLPPTLNAAFAG